MAILVLKKIFEFGAKIFSVKHHWKLSLRNFLSYVPFTIDNHINVIIILNDDLTSN